MRAGWTGRMGVAYPTGNTSPTSNTFTIRPQHPYPYQISNTFANSVTMPMTGTRAQAGAAGYREGLRRVREDE
jgi:hypothetical protein